MSHLTTAQIGLSGELLVQYRLLKLGIESAPMTTDAGIDLVAYSEARTKAITIQVKTNAAPKPGGGRGRLALDWWMSGANPAEIIALFSLEVDQVWLFTREEFNRSAQQRPSSGKIHLYFYVDPQYQARDGCHVRDSFKIENRVANLFGPSTVT